MPLGPGFPVLAYTGVEAQNPPQMEIHPRAPTATDIAFNLGTLWLNTATRNVYILVSLAGPVIGTPVARTAQWILFAGGAAGDVTQITGDDGLPVIPNAGGNINTLGAHGINTSRTAINSETFAINNSITLGDLAVLPAGNNALSATSGDINITAGNLKLANTNGAGSQGEIIFGGNRFISNFGVNNTFIGQNSGNTTLTIGSAQGCTALGTSCLNAITTGSVNTAIGYQCLILCTTGSNNTAFGALNLNNLTTGNQNTAVGQGSLSLLTTTSQNTALGNNSLSGIVTGANNIAVGFSAGSNNTTNDSNNIFIGNPGTVGDNNIIRFGVSGGGASQQNKCFIAGIRGITTDLNDAIAVLISSTGQLGTVSSSKRYKENVQDMGDESSVVMDLRPVIFYYKQHPQVPAWGLIAEEVAELFPQLVVYDKEGEPETVKYHELSVLLLNELQKLSKRVEELERKLNE